MVFMIVLVNADDDFVTYNLMVMFLVIFVCLEFDYDDFMSILSVMAMLLDVDDGDVSNVYDNNML